MWPGLPSDDQLASGNRIKHFALIRWPQHLAKWLAYHYIGTIATINVNGLPEVGADQTSGAMIWVVNAFHDPHETIATGWQVNPALYGDHDTHFFVSWQANYRGCYNLLCEGFVPYKGSKYVPGYKLNPVSKIDGDQFEITLKISQDLETGDWWLYSGTIDSQTDPVGHWPKSLFSNLGDYASSYAWGGVVEFNQDQKSPPMGSGLYPREGFRKASYVKNVRWITRDNDIISNPVYRYEDQTYCYQLDGDDPFYFGGPGGCTS